MSKRDDDKKNKESDVKKRDCKSTKDTGEKKADQKNPKEVALKKPDLRKLTKAMEECQDPKRFQHTLGVEFTAAALAMKHDASVKDAQIAGLLHDLAKCMSDEKKLSICSKYHLSVSDVEQNNPFLLHAKVGCCLAEHQYHITDRDILNAILYHTTGRPGMSKLEKIIFIADYIEPGRKQAPNLDQIRKLAFEDLDQAMIKILSDTLDYLQCSDGEIDPMTRETYDYYCKEDKS